MESKVEEQAESKAEEQAESKVKEQTEPGDGVSIQKILDKNNE